MFSELSAYHSHKHVPKNGVSLAFSNQNGPNKPFPGFNPMNNPKMHRPMLPKSDTAPTTLENQIANLWKSNSSDSYVSSEDVWKFCPSNNTISDYSSLSSNSNSTSPDDHSETFFNVASQLQRQTPPEMRCRQHDLVNLTPDYSKLFDAIDKNLVSADNLVKSSLCCQFILNNQCEHGDECIFAHSIMQLGQPISRATQAGLKI